MDIKQFSCFTPGAALTPVLPPSKKSGIVIMIINFQICIPPILAMLQTKMIRIELAVFKIELQMSNC